MTAIILDNGATATPMAATVPASAITQLDIEFVNRYYLEQLKKDNKRLFITNLEALMVSKTALDVKAYISSQVRKGK